MVGVDFVDMCSMKINKTLPRRCECGGRLKYWRDFNHIWCVCLKCTPVQKVDPKVVYKTNDLNED